MTDWLTEVVSVVDGVEEILEAVSDERRLLSLARDLARPVAWVRTQPRARGLGLVGLGAGLLVGGALLRSYGRPAATEHPRPWSNFEVAEPDAEEDWR